VARALRALLPLPLPLLGGAPARGAAGPADAAAPPATGGAPSSSPPPPPPQAGRHDPSRRLTDLKQQTLRLLTNKYGDAAGAAAAGTAASATERTPLDLYPALRFRYVKGPGLIP